MPSFISKRWLIAAIKIAVPTVILYWMFKVLDTSTIITTMKSADPTLFFISFAVLCIRNIIGAWRGAVILRHRGYNHTLLSLAQYYFIGNFFNLFMPEVIGRDLARGYYLFRSTSGQSAAVGSIVAERFNGTAALFLMSILSVGMATALDLDLARYGVIRAIAVIFAIFLIASLLILSERLDRFLDRLGSHKGLGVFRKVATFGRDVIDYCRAPRVMAKAFVISILFQWIGVVSAFLIARSLGDSTEFIAFMIILPVIWVVGMLPISISGLGLREGSFVILFSATGMPKETAMAISLLWFAQNIGLGLIGGVLFAMSKTGKSTPSE